MRYDYIIPVELKNYQPYTILYIHLISGYWAWFLSVVYANFYRLTKDTPGQNPLRKKVTLHESSSYWFMGEAKSMKPQPQKCGEIHVWEKILSISAASARESYSEFIGSTSWPPQGRTTVRTLQTWGTFRQIIATVLDQGLLGLKNKACGISKYFSLYCNLMLK